MRTAFLFTLMLLPVTLAVTAVPRQNHPYWQHWKQATFGKRALAGVGARAGVSQLLHHPRKWGGGANGFGKRLGAGFATHSVKTSVEHAIAAPLHEDLQYHRSTKRGFGPRLRHALVSTVVTQNTKKGTRTPAIGSLSGHAAAGAFSQGVLHAGAGAGTAGVGLAADAGANVAREFWPRHHARQALRSSPRHAKREG
jgi:hypothetical protein